MGKATILGSKDLNLAPGQYRVRIEKSDSRVATTNEQIDQELTILDDIIPERYSSYSDAIKAHKTAESDLDAVVRQSIESPDADHSAKINSATIAERTAYTNLIKAKSRYQAVVLKQQALQNKRSYLNNQITEDIRTVWCADCQKSLSGEVATMEIPGTDQIIMIRPGGADGSGSEYSVSRDGQLRSVASMSSAEAAWNYTMLPGWQKWKPIYRLGKITNRPPGASKCSVLLDQYSTVQGLATDVERQLHNVPMIYKNRDDGGPYVVGDRVVVEFYNQNWEAPRVIGYEEYPCTTTTAPPITPIIYTHGSSGAVLKYYVDTRELIGEQGNDIYCPGYPPCVFSGLTNTSTHLIQGALYHRKIVTINIDTNEVDAIYSDGFDDAFGFSRSPYPTHATWGIHDLCYDQVSGNLISTIYRPYTDSSGRIIVYSGISDTVIYSSELPRAGDLSWAYAPYAITVINGNLVVLAVKIQYAPLTITTYLLIMDGLTTTVTNAILWPDAYRYSCITHYDGNIIGTRIQGDQYKIYIHDGITPTITDSIDIDYTAWGITI